MSLGLPPINPGEAGHLLQAITGSSQSPTIIVGTFLVVLARLIGFLMVTPFFGGMNIPMTVRVAMATVISLVVSPYLQDTVAPGLIETGGQMGMAFLLLLVNQALVGVMLGFVGAFIFYAIESAGRIIDTQRGSNITDIIAPQTGDRTSPTGQWLNMIALVMLVLTGGHMLMLGAFIDSFRVFPATGSFEWITRMQHGHDFAGSAIHKFAELSGQSLLITVQVAAPAMISLMLADILLGIINRGAPQVNVFALSQVVKGPIGLGAVFVALTPIIGFINTELIPSIYEGKGSIGALARAMGGG